MSSGMPVTPEEMQEVMAREMPADLRFAARMPGEKSKEFHDYETIFAHMLEIGLMDMDLYTEALENRFSFKYHLPASAAPDYIKAISEAKNPQSLLAMVSQATGAKRIGEKAVAILREDVPGLDARELLERIREALVKKELGFVQAMELFEVVQAKLEAEGLQDDDEAKEALDSIRNFKKVAKKLGVTD